MLAVRVIVFVAGTVLIIAMLRSVIRTIVLPRSLRDGVARLVFLSIRKLFNLWTNRARSYFDRDRIMAYYAPVGLLMLLPTWLVVIMLGYTAIYWSLGVNDLSEAFLLSGSSLLTLGVTQPVDTLTAIAVFSEATIGLLLIALLIAYLPAMYASFARRENEVTLLEVRAGTPPSAVELLLRYNRIHGLDRLNELWHTFENWFADIEESHTSLAALAFFRSPQPDHSWITAAGAVLDAGALTNAALDIPHDPQADLCLRAGYLALRRIAQFFDISFDPNPAPDDPISISRHEFDLACKQLREGGLPLKADAEQAWRDFQGWRVNYDTVLLALAALTMAPYAQWSSDRSLSLATVRAIRARREAAKKMSRP